MASLTIELVFNAFANFFVDITLCSFINFLSEQLNLKGQRELAISETSMYQSVTEGKYMFFDTNFSKSS